MAQIRRRIRYSFAHGAAALAFVAMLSPAPSLADRPQETPGVPSKEEQKGFDRGVVAVSHPLAAKAGARILKKGGNAVDAAAAIQFALNVVEPQSSGIGGGGFMMIHLAQTNETFVIDSREKAPAAATPGMFEAILPEQERFNLASTSGISVGVPGTLRGVARALEDWGTMSLAQVLRPAIKLAKNGFKIGPLLAADIVDTTDRGFPMTNLQPETEAIFRPGGIPLKEGDRLVQRDLAKTFKLIAEQGPDVFYKGEIAQAIVDAQMRTRIGPPGVGRMTLADLDDYDVAIREPIVGNYRGFTIASMPPPSSGGLAIIQMLKMLERFPLGDTSQGFGFGAKNTLHVMIEAMRLAFADRAFWVGDEDFVPVPKVGLLADPYVQDRSADINLTSRIMPEPTAGDPLPFDTASPLRPKVKLAAAELQREGTHTTHFVVVDKHGNMVSYTTTVESLFGSGITVPGYGFILNNELTDFNLTPQFDPDPDTENPGANDVAPLKRPRSSMSPSMLFKDDKPFAAFGASGGATIINGLLQITFNILDHGMTIQEAINAPRISVNSPEGRVSCETGPFFPLPFTPTPPFSLAVLQALRDMRHDIPACSANIATGASSAAQAVIIDLETGKQFGAADPRREGTVIGFPRRHHKDDEEHEHDDEHEDDEEHEEDEEAALPSLFGTAGRARGHHPVYANVSP
jgi:gamma-glutamyltranspeptidase / glutathione hydrolase